MATKEHSSQAKLPSFQAFEVSTGKTVGSLPSEHVHCATFLLLTMLAIDVLSYDQQVAFMQQVVLMLKNAQVCGA